MQITAPTKSTRDYLRKSENVQEQLKRFLKQSGCTSKRKKIEAMRRAAVKG